MNECDLSNKNTSGKDSTSLLNLRVVVIIFVSLCVTIFYIMKSINYFRYLNTIYIHILSYNKQYTNKKYSLSTRNIENC